MTYRRLFHYLLVGSTILLAGLWWMSLRYYAGILWVPSSHRNGAVVGTFTRASVAISHAPHLKSVSGITTAFYAIPLPGGPIGETAGPLGRFHVGEGTPPGFTPGVRANVVEAPIWFPYLLFVGSAYAFTRFLEKRSGAAREKNLAEMQEKESI